MFLLILPFTIIAILGLVYTWIVTYEEVRAVKSLKWPKMLGLLCVLAVSIQLVLFVWNLSCFLGSIDRSGIEWSAKLQIPCLFVAVPCAFERKGVTRFLMILSSIYFMAIAGFSFLVSGIQF